MKANLLIGLIDMDEGFSLCWLFEVAGQGLYYFQN